MKIFILSIINNLSAMLSDTVINSLPGHKAHAVFIAALGELANLGPVVCIRIIIQHVRQTVTMITSC